LKINNFFSGGEPKDRIIKIDKLKRYANLGLRNEILNFAELWIHNPKISRSGFD